MSSHESYQDIEDKGIKSEEECSKKRRLSFPLDFSFASFREISQGYVQYCGEGGNAKDYEAWKM